MSLEGDAHIPMAVIVCRQMTVSLGIREGAGRRTVSPRPSHFCELKCFSRNRGIVLRITQNGECV